MYKIGDEVRLKRGWTRMVVIGFTSSGVMIAKYDSEDYHIDRRVKDSDFANPKFASGTKKRYPNEFVKWNGPPATKVYYTMATKIFKINAGTFTGLRGTFLNHTSNGDFVLELENGEVRSFHPSIVEEVIPFTFRAKSIANNYRCTYVAPAGSTINVGDILISDSGNVYCVLETNTKEPVTKGVFTGRRLVQEQL